ncbi:MAG: protein kinase domain-containing protein, partial [Kineosporiaceae bacterium]
MTDVVATPTVPGLILDRRLGSGDHGEVWRALDLGAVGAVAVLVGRPATSAGAAAREAALLRRIDHANVLRLRSVLDLADGRRALVMDLAEAGDLPQLVRRLGPLPVGEVATLTIALARALEHVHALGFVHGRLTPHQVLFH